MMIGIDWINMYHTRMRAFLFTFNHLSNRSKSDGRITLAEVTLWYRRTTSSITMHASIRIFDTFASGIVYWKRKKRLISTANASNIFQWIPNVTSMPFTLNGATAPCWPTIITQYPCCHPKQCHVLRGRPNSEMRTKCHTCNSQWFFCCKCMSEKRYQCANERKLHSFSVGGARTLLFQLSDPYETERWPWNAIL